jgi:valyl-tRNA synthetase
MQKEKDRLEKDVASKQARLEDETFRSRAPEHIVKGLESTLAERRVELEKVNERIAQLERI